jgi:phage/plasmid-like protein (TIGR03299 family)
MAHEIERHDNVVLHREKAWHGLGIVVENAPTPREGLQIAGLDWDVEQWPITATKGGVRIAIDDRVANVRTDISTTLGIVGAGYQPIQNRELADFCEALAEQGDVVKIESAGSIRNGAKVWFLLKGESFSVRGADEIKPYILVSNGHDGGTALRCTPTTVRVVCSNTLHMVIPQYDGRAMRGPKAACFSTTHTKNVKERIEAAKCALGLYGRSLERTRELINEAAVKEMTVDQVRKFFLASYVRDFGAINDNPTTAGERRRLDNANAVMSSLDLGFANGRSLCGNTAWNAFNAYTDWIQHGQQIRGKTEAAKVELRVGSQLFGVDTDRCLAALGAALAV